MKRFYALSIFLFISSMVFPQTEGEIITFNLIHTPVTSATVLKDLEIRATILPSKKVAYASLNYRLEGEMAYTVLFMQNIGGDSFSVTIPGDRLVPPAFEYFIFVMDVAGIPHILFRDQKHPQRVEVLVEAMPATEVPAPGALEEEFALFAAENVVIAAAKREQKISEAPAAVTVLTEEEIRSAGIISLTDVFRLVPGMDVALINPSDHIFNARGFGTEKGNRMLLLIDGRTVANDFFGKNFIESIPVPVEDIKRIEVIRGPGSSLYGANAYSGIISIITKKPEESEKIYASAVAGGTMTDVSAYPFGTEIYTARGASSSEEIGFLASAGYKEFNDLLNPNFIIHSIGRGRARMRYKVTPDSHAGLDVGVNRTEGNTFATLGVFNYKFDDAYAQATYDYKELKAQFYWKRSFTRIPLIVSLFGIEANLLGEDFTGLSNAFDWEVQHSFKTGDINRITYGGNFRFNTFSSPIILKEVEVDGKKYRLDREILGGIFLQDEFRPRKDLILTVDARFDKFSITPSAISPRANITYIPFPAHAFRTAYGRAFRKPIYMEAQMIPAIIPYDLDVLLGMEGNIFIGNPRARNEEIESVELGYRGQITEQLRVTVDTFYNELRNFINFTVQQEPSFNLQYLNETKQFYGRGGEVAIEFYPLKEVKTLLNFSLLDKLDELDQPDVLVRQVLYGINLGVFGRYEGIHAALMTHHKSNYYRMLANPKNPLESQKYLLPYYTLVNINIGYEIVRNHLTLGLFIFNLFNDVHREFEGTEIYNPYTYEPEASGGEKIGRRIFGYINGRF